MSYVPTILFAIMSLETQKRKSRQEYKNDISKPSYKLCFINNETFHMAYLLKHKKDT